MHTGLHSVVSVYHLFRLFRGFTSTRAWHFNLAALLHPKIPLVCDCCFTTLFDYRHEPDRSYYSSGHECALFSSLLWLCVLCPTIFFCEYYLACASLRRFLGFFYIFFGTCWQVGMPEFCA
ncbi:hypothetical protein BO78DRAFT_162079 [Aspergillus sclerotiicarbonarius CBS 121057]|uniref:Uncharacterized protein n=1 Tax=Aspergillus sclerotiicarbonarius (strain CBS 121057 / IBT 28362) TaxID=1448318 RepID=A0A319ELD4_ASPSB|nr:hypothetical protein BO78DRAFT_162079 [Aspergillus sclerotiicarbonarius CBS 121057]